MSDVHVTEQSEDLERPGAEVFDITTKRPTIPAPPADRYDDDEEESPRLRPVDSPDLPSPGVTTYKRLPIVPSWLKSKPGFVSTTQRAASNAFYATAFHGIRTPWYALQLGRLAPRGVARLVRDTNAWVWDAEAARSARTRSTRRTPPST